MPITRDVVSDLWPLYASGEASADSRALVEEFLRADPEFARRLEGTPAIPAAAVSLSPDAETKALARTRDLVHGRRWLRALRLLALALTGLAVARALEHARWDEGTRRWVGTAGVAALAWVLYLGLVLWHRRRALR